ncbi:hypothetical protein AB0F72_11740 [Actinoplanes sp. NPDC023936]|uniref:hypothetical protein n=1 Tax=Actinoplanes sp. NPDC023936 TaxID=3154910 RepID=UPI0033EE7CAA
MAFRSWVKLLATTTAAAAVVGAGQLGLAYGLSMVRLDRDLDVTASDQWTSQLAWVAWIAMTAAALGAIVGTGFRPRWRPQPVGTGGALGIGLASGLGALVVLPLTMQPARSAQVAGVNPVFVIGVCAGLGVAIGVFAAWAAAARAVVRWNIAALTVLVWVIGLAAVVPTLLPGKTPAPVRLGVLEGDFLPAVVNDRTPFVTMPLLALFSGLLLGLMARGRRMPTFAVALTGLAGPALLTVAYLIAGPGESTGFTFSPYWSAMFAAGAGVLGSVLAVIIRGAPERAHDAEPSTAAGAPANGATPAGATQSNAAAGNATPGNAAAGNATPSNATPSNATLSNAAPSNTAPNSAGDQVSAPLPRRDQAAPSAPGPSAIAAAAAAAAQRPDPHLHPSDTGVLTVADRPHPLADLANQAPATAPNSPFNSGTGTPFGQPPQSTGRFSGPGPQDAAPRFAAPAPTPHSAAPHSAAPHSAAPHSAAPHSAAPHSTAPHSTAPHSAAPRFAGPQSAAPAPHFSGRQDAPAQFSGQDAPARFSGQQEAAPGPRRGWRARRSAPENPPASPAASFDGFTTGNPGPRTGIDTAEHPRITPSAARPPVVEPTSISGPPPQRGSQSQQDEYVNWVNGLGGA